MCEIRIVDPGKTRGYPYRVCKKTGRRKCKLETPFLARTPVSSQQHYAQWFLLGSECIYNVNNVCYDHYILTSKLVVSGLIALWFKRILFQNSNIYGKNNVDIYT